MRTSRFILYTALATIVCVLYVAQQTEIVKLGYKITAAEKILQATLDRRTSLEYTLTSLESPLSLDKQLLQQKDGYEMAQRYKFVKVDAGQLRKASASKSSRLAKGSTFKRLAFQSFFAGKSAEAKTIK
jgi:hypothetical protein